MFVDFLTLITSKLKTVKTPNFGKQFLRPRLRITQSLNTAAAVLLEILPLLKSFLADFLILITSKL